MLRTLVWIYFMLCIYQTLKRKEFRIDPDSEHVADTLKEVFADEHEVMIFEKAIQKVTFFMILAILGSIWFLHLPILVIFAQSLGTEHFPVYLRFKVFMAVTYTVTFLLELIIAPCVYSDKENHMDLVSFRISNRYQDTSSANESHRLLELQDMRPRETAEPSSASAMYDTL